MTDVQMLRNTLELLESDSPGKVHMTPKQEAALRLAREALEYIEHNYMSLPAPATKALAAIDEALAEQQAQQRPQNCGTGYCSCIECPYEQPAQQQEPVAWRHDMGEENGGWEYFEEASCPECQPLYTSPPASKPWVGLSTDEIYDMYNEPRSDAEMVEFARAIEAKLKEKNNG